MIREAVFAVAVLFLGGTNVAFGGEPLQPGKVFCMAVLANIPSTTTLLDLGNGDRLLSVDSSVCDRLLSA